MACCQSISWNNAFDDTFHISWNKFLQNIFEIVIYFSWLNELIYGQEKLINCFSLIGIWKWMRARGPFLFFLSRNLSFNTVQQWFFLSLGITMYKSTNTFQPSRGLVFSLVGGWLNNWKVQLEFLHPLQFFFTCPWKMDARANEKQGSFFSWPNRLGTKF